MSILTDPQFWMVTSGLKFAHYHEQFWLRSDILKKKKLNKNTEKEKDVSFCLSDFEKIKASYILINEFSNWSPLRILH